jgi:hypothetical protein
MRFKFPISTGIKTAQTLIAGDLPTAIQNRLRVGPRVLYPKPLPKPWHPWSPRRLNTLLEGLAATRYLEIGVANGTTIDRIIAHSRVGVDPSPDFDVARLPKGLSFFGVESDAYFDSLDADTTFDVVFIDGLHTFEQTKSDLFNAFRHVPYGPILIDDTVPSDEIAAIPDIDDSYNRRKKMASDDRRWMGDVWKLVVYIDKYLPQLNFRTIVGSGNIQTLVWRKNVADLIIEPTEEGGVAELSYREVFLNGIPAEFRTCEEEEALALCLRECPRTPSVSVSSSSSAG